ncbi:HAD-IA family hydrolase [bacterium]|nr:HAD-IA family hydrolase [bacterium]
MYLFDLGKVVLSYDQEATMKKLAGSLNPLTALLIFAKKDEFMAEFKRDTELLESGRMTMSQFFLRLKGKTGLDLTEEQFMEIWQSGYEYYPDVLSKIAELSQKEKCGVAANLSEAQEEILRKREDFAPFTDWACSWKLGILRNSPDFFLKAAELLNVRPEDCTYVDDREENLAFAKEAGMKTLLYTLIADLDKLS